MAGWDSHFCDICCRPANLSDSREDFARNSEKLLPGSNGSQILNTHLRVYFIAKKLLKCSETDSLSLLTSVTSYNAETGGGDAHSIGRFCSGCESTVSKALELHCKIVALQSEINKLGKTLINQIHSCHNNSENSVGIGFLGIKLRELLNLYDFADTSIKKEAEPEDIPFDEDYEDFDDETFECENTSIKYEPSETVREHHTSQLLSGYQKRTTKKRIPTKLATYDRDPKGNFICKFCDSLYTTYPGIVKHYRMHKESRSLGMVYDCNICRHPNLSDSKLRRHMKKFHGTLQAKQENAEITREHIQGEETNEHGHVDLQYSSESDSDQSQKNSKQRKSQKVESKHHPTASSETIAQSKSIVVTNANHAVQLSSEQEKRKHEKRIPKLKTYDRDPKGNFICKFCDSLYTTYPGIVKHYRMHKESRLLGKIYDCNICRHPNLSDSKLRRHMKKFHGTLQAKQDNGEITQPSEEHFQEETNENEDADLPYSSESDSDVPKFSKRPQKTKLLKKLAQSESTTTYACKLCESVYTTTPGFSKHMRAHEQSQLLGNKYDCPTCRHPCHSDSKLRRHITAVHNGSCTEETESSPNLPSASKFECQRCESVYLSVTGIKKHERIHRESDELGNIFDCPVCRHPTTTEKNLRIHISTQHHNKMPSTSGVHRGQVGNFSCKRCESVYTSYTGIRKHQRMHKESDDLANLFDCPICRHPTTSEKNLRIHISVIHQNKIPSEYQNEICNKFPNMDVEQQSSGENFNCDRCESVYTSVTGIRKHERMHEESDLLGNKYDCSICRHPTTSEKNLKIHITMAHHIKMPFGQYETSVNLETSNLAAPEQKRSGDTFENESDDESETEVKSYTQSSDGNFQCKFCDSVYTSYTGITKHDCMHKGSNLLGNIYDCSICRHPNLSDSRLRRHMKMVHGKLQKKGQNPHASKLKHETGTKLLEKFPTQEDDLILPQRAQERTEAKIKAYSDGISEDNDDEAKSDKNDKDWTPDEFDKMESSGKQQLTMYYLSGDNGLYHCDKCNVSYKSARGYQRHEEEHQASTSLGHKFDCHCGFPASSEQRLRYHKKRVHVDAFTCSVCGYQVQKAEQLVGHMKKHCKPDSTFKSIKIKGGHRVRIRNKRSPEKIECQICKAKFWYESSIKKHMEAHEKTELINKVWDCNICNFPCFSENQLKRHKTKHGQKKVTCTICQRTCANPPLLRAHMRIHVEYDKAEDPATGLFSCTFCSYVGRSRRALISHKTALHRAATLDSSVEYLLCPQCGKSFYNLGTLRKHIKNIHENIYTYTCEECGKGFDSKSGFNNHKMTHQKVRTKQHICDTCGASYSYKHSLQAHMAKYHSTGGLELDKIPAFARDGRRFPKAKDYKCRWCEVVFPFKYMLVNHMPTAHGDLYIFNCDKCDKKYITSSSLKLHKEITHTDGSQTFACKYCQKVFAHKHYAICHYKSCEAKRNIDNA